MLSFGLSTTGLEACESSAVLSWTESVEDSSKRWHNRSIDRSLVQSPYHFKQKLSKGPLWTDSNNSYCVIDEPESRRLVAGAEPYRTVNDANAFDTVPASLIWACCKNKDLQRGIRMHEALQKMGSIDINHADALITMYAKCGELHKAKKLLEEHSNTNIVPWNALIAGYVRNNQCLKALDCFEQMQCKGIFPNEVTFVSILKACATIGALDKGENVHNELLKQRLLEHHIVLGGALVDMYAKCGQLCKARSVLESLPSRNTVCWNALITGYAQNRQGQQALECFEQMQTEGIIPDEVTYVCILKACALIGALEKGKEVHDEILRRGLLEHHVVLGGALVDMYAKCGVLNLAQEVLEKLPSRSVVSWDALIAGYIQNGQGRQALICFGQMQREGIRPDEVTYAGILKACASIAALDKGKEIHDEILRQGLLEHHVILGGALVDMYAKCGALSLARNTLENLPSRNVIAWGALISGYAQNGLGRQALDCFEQMQHEGVLPDEITFCCVLNVCSQLGLVEKGLELVDRMELMSGFKPTIETFICMVDLLGRAGHLGKAVKVIQGMPVAADSVLWHCLLGACRKWVDVDVGTWAFEQAIDLDQCDEAAYMLMVNIFAEAGMYKKAKDTEARRMKNMSLALRHPMLEVI